MRITRNKIHKFAPSNYLLIAAFAILVVSLNFVLYPVPVVRAQGDCGVITYIDGAGGPSPDCSGSSQCDSTSEFIQGGSGAWCTCLSCSGGGDVGGGGVGTGVTPDCSHPTDQCGGSDGAGGTCGTKCDAGCPLSGTSACGATCPDGTPLPAGGLSACPPAPCPLPTLDTQTTSCPVGQTGSNTQQRVKGPPPSCTWGPWKTTSSSCSSPTCPDGSAAPNGDTTQCACVPITSCAAQGLSSGIIYNGCQSVICGTFISVSTNLPGGSWTINPGQLSGTGNGGYSVTPVSGGSVYNLTPGAIAGYSVNVTSSTGQGQSIHLAPGDLGSFLLQYSASASSGFDYSLGTSGILNVTKGDPPHQETITETLLSGTSQPVTIAASGQPSGVTISYANQGCSPTCNAFINVTVPVGTATGQYTINVQGNGGGIAHSTSFVLNVLNPSSFSVTCSASPSSAQVGQPVTWTATPIGGMPPYSYQWSGTDFTGTPTTSPYTFTYQTIGAKTATAVVTDITTSQQATCPANGANTVQVGVQPIFQEF